jgi:hypothetical protein
MELKCKQSKINFALPEMQLQRTVDGYVASVIGHLREEIAYARTATVKPSGGQEPQRAMEYVREQIHHLFADKI